MVRSGHHRYQRPRPPPVLVERITKPRSHTTRTAMATHHRTLSAKPAPKRIRARSRTRSRGTIVINLQHSEFPAIQKSLTHEALFIEAVVGHKALFLLSLFAAGGGEAALVGGGTDGQLACEDAAQALVAREAGHGCRLRRGVPLVEERLRDVEADRLDVAGRGGAQLLAEQPGEVTRTDVESPGELGEGVVPGGVRRDQVDDPAQGGRPGRRGPARGRRTVTGRPLDAGRPPGSGPLPD